MIIAVSDTHLGSPVANEKGFLQFIRNYLRPNQNDIEHLFLLGDIIDLWRRPNPEVLVECREVLRELSSLAMEKHYMVGNHDYEVLSLGMMGDFDHPAANVIGSVELVKKFEYDGLAMRFCHGHQIEYWQSIPFYESFCKAMCYYDPAIEELADLWSLVARFAEKEAPNAVHAIQELTMETRTEIENAFAGPLNASMVNQAPNLLKEWILLSHVSNIDFLQVMLDPEALEQTATRILGQSNMMAVTNLGKFEDLWKTVAEEVSQHDLWTEVAQSTKTMLQRCKRIAGSITIGLEPDEFLVRGHGHRAYVDQDHFVADAGCWLGTNGSYLVISDGKVQVKHWIS